MKKVIPDNSQLDMSETYDKQRKKFRPWAIAFLIWFLLIIVTPPLFWLIGVNLRVYVQAIPFMLILLFPFAVKTYAASRCPACGKYMGRDFSAFCTVCGARIRHLENEDEENHQSESANE